jgi:lipoprotein-releasing system permease protein
LLHISQTGAVLDRLPQGWDGMYKLLLCWRYLRTRYIALICIVSVMLGVATMIVVNSVMAGFLAKTTSEMNAMLGDVVLQVHSMDGVADANAHMEEIRRAAGDDVVGMSPVAAVPALIYMQVNGGLQTRPVTLVGIDEATYASVSSLGKYLQHPANRRQLSFQLQEGAYDSIDHAAADPQAAKPRQGLEFAGWTYRRLKAAHAKEEAESKRQENPAAAQAGAAPEFEDPFAAAEPAAEGATFDPAVEQHPGIVLAMSEVSFRDAEGAVHLYIRPGDDVQIAYPQASIPPKPLSGSMTIVDVYQYPLPIDNGSMAFVPLAFLQRARGMIDPTTGVGGFTAIQIKLKAGVDANAVRDKLRMVFNPEHYSVTSWQDSQAALLSAIKIETVILNILLLFIVAVAGFGILAIFYMIVVEKTRDIGILKSLGASGRGVMGIFLAYGLSLGIVGAGAGTLIGVSFSRHINPIAKIVDRALGLHVFDSAVYGFDTIPTVIDPWTISWIVASAVATAVLAGVLPAFRAANLHPVRALRFE